MLHCLIQTGLNIVVAAQSRMSGAGWRGGGAGAGRQLSYRGGVQPARDSLP